MNDSEIKKKVGILSTISEQDEEIQWTVDNPEGFTAVLESYALKRAQSGSITQARIILKSIADSIERDALSGVWKQWLILALREISQGGDPRTILMTSGKKGKDPDRENKIWHRNRGIYFYLQRVKAATPEITKADACADLLDKLGVTADPPELDISAVREVLKSKDESDDELLSLFSRITSADAIAKAYDQIAKEELALHKDMTMRNGNTLAIQSDHRPLFKKKQK